MARKKKKGSSRRHPLVFVESPVEVSRRFPSPVFAARHPVRANLVSVMEKQHSWLSPQIDPNAPYTPPKRRGARRNKAACSVDPLTQTQGRKEITRKDKANPYTSLKFINGSAARSRHLSNDVCKSRQLTTNSQSTDLTESVSESKVGETRTAEEQGSSFVCGIATRTRAKQRCFADNSQCENGDQLCLCKLTLESSDGASDKENSPENDHFRKQSKKIVSPHEQRDCSSLISEDDHDISCCSDAVSGIRKQSQKRGLRKNLGVMGTWNGNPGDVHPCHSISTYRREDTTPKRRMHQSETYHKPSKSPHAQCARLDISREPTSSQARAKQKHPRARRKSGKGVKVLAVDTPESDYGIRVSLRRRCKLLRTPARNKLMDR